MGSPVHGGGPGLPPGAFARKLDPGMWARVVNAARHIANNQGAFHGQPNHGPSMPVHPMPVHPHLGQDVMQGPPPGMFGGHPGRPAFAGQVNPGGADPNTFTMGLPQPMGNAPMGGFAGPVNPGGADPNTFTMGLPPGQSVAPIDPVQAEIDRIHNWINTTYGHPRPQQAPRGSGRLYQ